VSTRRGDANTKRADSTATLAGQVSRERLGSTVTVLTIEQALADLGIHERLSEIVAKTYPSRAESCVLVRTVSGSARVE
jgi:hypothetical protein